MDTEQEVLVGRRFTVTEPQEIKGEQDQILARYLPEHEYTVTARIAKAVNFWVEQGKAKIGARAQERRKGFRVQSDKVVVKGAANTGKASTPPTTPISKAPATKAKTTTKKETK